MSTNQKWEPLTTAEEAFLARRDGRIVEFKTMTIMASGWAPTTCSKLHEFRSTMARGFQYRALVEGGAP